MPSSILPVISDANRRGTFARFLRDRGGSAAIEFAFVAPPLIALLIAILETSLCFFAQEALETANEATARLVLTGQAQSGGGGGSAYTQQQFKTYACSQLPSFMSCANTLLDVRTAAGFGGADTSVPTLTYDSNGNVTNSFAYDLGTASSIVTVRLMYLWPISLSPLNPGLSNAGNGKRLLVATSVARSEAYVTPS